MILVLRKQNDHIELEGNGRGGIPHGSGTLVRAEDFPWS